MNKELNVAQQTSDPENLGMFCGKFIISPWNNQPYTLKGTILVPDPKSTHSEILHIYTQPFQEPISGGEAEIEDWKESPGLAVVSQSTMQQFTVPANPTPGWPQGYRAITLTGAPTEEGLFVVYNQNPWNKDDNNISLGIDRRTPIGLVLTSKDELAHKEPLGIGTQTRESSSFLNEFESTVLTRITPYLSPNRPNSVYTNCDFSHVSFWYGDFAESDFDGCDFSNAFINYKIFAPLGATFTNCTWTGLRTNGPLNFGGSIVENATLSSLDFTGARWQGDGEDTRRKGGVFTNCTFAGVTFAGAIFAVTSFSDCKLEGEDLSSSRFQGVTFTRCSLSKANLSNATFERHWQREDTTILKDCDLQDANLQHATFTEVTLDGCQLQGCDLSYADLSGISLVGYDLSGVNLSHANLSRANLTGCKFSKNNFEGASFAGATLVNAVFTDCDISGVDFSGLDFSGATFTNVTMQGTNFEKARFAQPELRQVFTGQTDLLGWSGVKFAGADFTNVRFAADTKGRTSPVDLLLLDLSNCNFKGADLSYVQCAGSIFNGANFEGTVLDHTMFSSLTLRGVEDQATLHNVDLSKASSADHVTFDRADLAEVNFSGCNLAMPAFKLSRLNKVNFARCTMRDPDFTGSLVSLTSFQNASLGQACFKDALISGSDFSGVDLTAAMDIPTLTSTETQPMIFANAKVRVSFLGEDWSWFDLTGATILDLQNIAQGSPLKAQYAKLTKLNGGNLAKLKLLPKSDFTGATFDHLDLSGADFTGVIISGASFAGANLTGATLARVQAHGAHFGALSLVFTLDVELERALVTNDVEKIKDAFAGGHISLSAPVTLTQESAIWQVSSTSPPATYLVTLDPAAEGTGKSAIYLYNDGVRVSLDDASASTFNTNNGQQLIALFQKHSVSIGGTVSVVTETTSWNIVDSKSQSFTVRKQTNSKGIVVLGVYESMEPANLSYAFMPDADLSDAVLFGVNASYCHLYGDNASLASATLEEANFSNANLAKIVLEKSTQLLGTNLTGAILIDANLKGATIGPSRSGQSASMSGAYLQGTDFTDVNLIGATSLAGASVAVLLSDNSTSGVYLFSLPAEETTALKKELDEAAWLFNLNLENKDETFTQLQDELDKGNLPFIKQVFPGWLIMDSGEIAYSVVSRSDAGGEKELYVTPQPTGTSVSLNKGDSTAYQACVSALDNDNIQKLRPIFKKAGCDLSDMVQVMQLQSLPDSAEITVREASSEWQIGDHQSCYYRLWAGLSDDGDGKPRWINVARPMDTVTSRFQKLGWNLRWASTVLIATKGSAWLLDNDTKNPKNLDTGYMQFLIQPDAKDGTLDVYGTSITFEVAASTKQRGMEPYTCNQTHLIRRNVSDDVICPNGLTASDNDQNKLPWEKWLRTPQPPLAPTCVPGDDWFCTPPWLATAESAGGTEG
jgi:uncharacterized protein YjbI with pentapeptide repeats